MWYEIRKTFSAERAAIESEQQTPANLVLEMKILIPDFIDGQKT